ncbi:phosphate-starvation-inducible PsiE family protein [Methanolobus sp. ZRKC2]|uniref:phosphate-starvation-inducible PsiE family protein n=1 Tax=Methanolobus sp. ZRKC2 TaxID=3125783 RepID=UPI00324F5FA3
MKHINSFQRLIVWVVILMMVLVILSATVEIGWIILYDLVTPPVFLLDVDRILDIFGLFFIVIIGIELLETIKMVLEESIMNVDVIILVGLTAVVRKILIIDIKETDPMFLVGMGVLIVTLAATYYLVIVSGKEFKCSID